MITVVRYSLTSSLFLPRVAASWSLVPGLEVRADLMRESSSRLSLSPSEAVTETSLQRETMVGSRLLGELVERMIIVLIGGSSRVFKRACWAGRVRE